MCPLVTLKSKLPGFAGLAIALLLAGRVEAEQIFFVAEPKVPGPLPPGTFAIFEGTVTNNTGVNLTSSQLFFNFNAFDPAVITPVQLLGVTTAEFPVPTGSTSGIVDLFSLNIAPSAQFQTYSVDVTLQDVTNNISNRITVNTTVVPEPSTILLLGIGSAVLSTRLRKSRSIFVAGVCGFQPVQRILKISKKPFRFPSRRGIFRHG